MDNGIDQLERRLTQAEETIALLRAAILPSREPGTTVRAPFRVVDDENNLVFEAYGRREKPFVNEIRVFNRQGQQVASLGAQADGGFLAIRNDAGQLLGYLSVGNKGARLEIDNTEATGAVILSGYESEDTGGIMINSKVSTIELWATSEGSGIDVWNRDLSSDNPARNAISVSVAASNDKVEIRDKEGRLSVSGP